jgi:beta-lactamase class D
MAREVGIYPADDPCLKTGASACGRDAFPSQSAGGPAGPYFPLGGGGLENRLRTLAAAMAAAVILSAFASAQELDPLLDEAGVTGALIVHRVSDGREWTGGGERIDERFIPASTFKIPNSLIILETGVVTDAEGEVLAWDGESRWVEAWNQDQTLAEAFPRSTVWAYQEWARRVGHADMVDHVAAMDYGSDDIGGAGDVDRFWLEGPLKISTREQIAFLSRLHAREVPYREEVMETVISVMETGAGEGWTLRGKTGWRFDGDPDIGWHAGWLEQGGETYLFALNIDMPDPDREVPLRTVLTRRALEFASGWQGG